MKMKVFFIQLSVLIFGFQGILYSQTDVSGNITSNTTWQLVDSPFSFSADAAVAPGVVLTIEAGVVVEGNGFDLVVYGDFRALGAVDLKIEINNLNISISDSDWVAPFPKLDIDHCIIEGGSVYETASSYGVLSLTNSSLISIPYMYIWYPGDDCNIERNKFINSGGISVGTDAVNVYVKDNLFYNWTTDYAVENWAAYNGGLTTVQYNTFYNTDKIAVKVGAETDCALDAINNYWYTTGTVEIEAMIYDKVDNFSYAVIPYLPFLTGPTSETPLHAEFEADKVAGLAPITVNFSNLGAGELREFIWDFGDGSTSDLENPHHVYDTPGDYTVSLTVSDFLKSDTKVYTNLIHVSGPPVAAFSVDNTEGCIDDMIVFTDESTGNILSRKWFINETNSETEAVFNWMLDQVGTADIKLVVFNEYTSDTLLKEDYITTYQIPTNDFTAVDVMCGLNQLDVVYAGNASDQATYTWNFDGATIVSGSGQGAFVLEWDAYGEKTISLDVSEDGCSSPSTKTSIVSVREVPVASFISGSEICNNSPVDISFTGSASVNAIFNWGLDGASYTGDYPSGDFEITFPSGGLKTISLSITDNACHSENIPNANIDVTYPYEGQEICMVTIDTETGNNMIVWERMDNPTIDSYVIYREGTTANQYDDIGVVDHDNISIFVDGTAENSNQTYRYKIGLIDTCGNYSGLSGYHEPIFLQYTGSTDGVNLEWGTYKIEDQEVSFSSYVIYRGSDSTELVELATISGNFNRYTDNSDEALLAKYFYRVGGLLSESCAPADFVSGKKVGSGPFVHSFSNLEDNRIKTGVNPVSRPRLSVYPNPSSDFIQVKIPEAIGKFNCKLISITGQTVRETVLYTNFWKIEKNNLPSGLYFIEIDGKNSYFRKIIFE